MVLKMVILAWLILGVNFANSYEFEHYDYGFPPSGYDSGEVPDYGYNHKYEHNWHNHHHHPDCHHFGHDHDHYHGHHHHEHDFYDYGGHFPPPPGHHPPLHQESLTRPQQPELDVSEERLSSQETSLSTKSKQPEAQGPLEQQPQQTFTQRTSQEQPFSPAPLSLQTQNFPQSQAPSVTQMTSQSQLFTSAPDVSQAQIQQTQGQFGSGQNRPEDVLMKTRQSSGMEQGQLSSQRRQAIQALFASPRQGVGQGQSPSSAQQGSPQADLPAITTRGQNVQTDGRFGKLPEISNF